MRGVSPIILACPSHLARVTNILGLTPFGSFWLRLIPALLSRWILV